MTAESARGNLRQNHGQEVLQGDVGPGKEKEPKLRCLRTLQSSFEPTSWVSSILPGSLSSHTSDFQTGDSNLCTTGWVP